MYILHCILLVTTSLHHMRGARDTPSSFVKLDLSYKRSRWGRMLYIKIESTRLFLTKGSSNVCKVISIETPLTSSSAVLDPCHAKDRPCSYRKATRICLLSGRIRDQTSQPALRSSFGAIPKSPAYKVESRPSGSC